MKRFNIKTQKGFTLIEMLVSVALFAVVMTISLGVIVSIIDGNKKTQAINSVVNNLNFSIDSMVRDIKTGYNYNCNSNPQTISDLKSLPAVCSNASTPYTYVNLVSTISGSEAGVRYQFATDSKGIGRIEKVKCDNTTCYSPIAITSNEINIKTLQFYVNTPAGGTGQPAVFLIIKGTAKLNATTYSDFNLQTFISQRLLNI